MLGREGGPLPGRRQSRRDFLRTSATASATGLALVLAGCSQPPTQSAPGVGGDRSEREPYLNFTLYPDYIDGAPDGPFATLDRFAAISGVQVNLSQDLVDPAVVMAGLRKRFELGLPTSTDLIVMPDSLIAEFSREGWLQRYDEANMVSVYRAMSNALYTAPADKLRRYSIPWAAGTTAIAYDSAATSEPTSFRQLLEDPRLRGRVGIFAELDNSLPSLACGFGTTATELAPTAVDRAIAAVAQASDRGQLGAVYGEFDYLEAFTSGRVVAGLAYSGDILNLQVSMPTIRFSAPAEGAELWSDSLVVPRGAPHRVNAEDLLKFYYEPENAAQLAAALQYMSPVPSAKGPMQDIDPSVAASPLVFPSAADLSGVSIARILRTDERRRWTAAWDEALGLGGTDGG